MALRPRFSLLGDTKLPRTKPFREMGVSGTPSYGGYQYSGEKSSKWRGEQKYITATEMVSNITIVAASVHYFLNILAHPRWNVVPSDQNDPEAVELCNFVKRVLDQLETPWSSVVKRAGMYRFYGFGIQEWTAKRLNDGSIGLKTIEPRPQSTIDKWAITDNGSVKGVWQRSAQTGKLIGLPRRKIIYLVEDTISDSPEGLGIFRHLLEPYFRLKQYLELEIRGFERDMRGIPIGRAPLSLLAAQVKAGIISQAVADTMVENLNKFVQMQVKKSDSGIVLDSQPFESLAADGRKVSTSNQWGLELLTGGGAGLMELAMAIDRTQREIARVIGTEMLMMGDKTGNRATSTDKSRNLYLISNAVLAHICKSFRNDLIVPLWRLNGFPVEKMPHFKTEDVSFASVQEMTDAIHKLASAGAMITNADPAVNEIRDLLGLERVNPADPITPPVPSNTNSLDDDEEMDIDDADDSSSEEEGDL